MDIEDIMAEGKSSGSEDEKPRAAKKARNCDVFSGSAMWFAISIHFCKTGKIQINSASKSSLCRCFRSSYSLFFHFSEQLQEERKTKGKAEPKRKELNKNSHCDNHRRLVNWIWAFRCAYHLQDHSEDWPQGPGRFGGSHPPKPGGFTRAHGPRESGPPKNVSMSQQIVNIMDVDAKLVEKKWLSLWSHCLCHILLVGRSRHCRPHPASRQDLEKSQCFSSFSIILIKNPTKWIPIYCFIFSCNILQPYYLFPEFLKGSKHGLR